MTPEYTCDYSDLDSILIEIERYAARRPDGRAMVAAFRDRAATSPTPEDFICDRMVVRDGMVVLEVLAGIEMIVLLQELGSGV